MFVAGILLMGGIGKRFGKPIPKQFTLLAGKEVFEHTLLVFQQSHLFDEIILVCPKEWISHVQNLVPPSIRLVAGGSTRQASSFAGIQATSPTADIVVLHDAVRPFITEELLKKTIEAASLYGAVDTCIPTTDTIVSGSTAITSIPDRSTLFRGQTPQSFKKALLLDAHIRTCKQDATDDCQLIHDLGIPVHILLGNEKNIKITTELDLFIAEQIIRMNTRIPERSSHSLQGKRYVITGGTGGLGTALATQLATCGAIPILFSRSSSEYPVDLTDYEATREAFTSLQHPIDGLINCVGHLDPTPLAAHTHEAISRAIATNFTAVVYACQFAPLLTGGHIVNVSSSSYSRGRKGYVLYSASKAAVVNFTQGLAEEYPHLHINAVIPPRMNTPMRTDNFPSEDTSTLLSPETVAEEIISILTAKTTNILYEVKL